VLPEIQIYYIIRASLGVLIFGSALIGLYNIARSLLPGRGGTP
jgi:cytochrome c oxidase cbb3-type subunit 1/cytochrome c oxidase cbb3-type subunit I/II